MSTGKDSESQINLSDGRTTMSCDNGDIEENGEQFDTAELVLSLAGYSDSDYLTKAGMCHAFKCTQRTVQRMVDRFEIPPPMPFAGRNIWIVGRLKAWIVNAAERIEGDALKEAKRMNYTRA